MIWKLLLTSVVLVLGWMIVRARMGQGGPPAGGATAHPPASASASLARPAARVIAYALLALAAVGSGLYLLDAWRFDRRLVRVDVVNGASGSAESFLVRHADIRGRSFLTVDGREIRLAESDRLIVREAEPAP